MGLSQSGANGGNTPGTLLFLFGAVLMALIIAYAAKNNKVIPVGPQPTPSVSATATQ